MVKNSFKSKYFKITRNELTKEESEEALADLDAFKKIISKSIETKEQKKEREKFEMDNLINHSLSYAENKLEGTNANIIIIGDGENIIDHLPKKGSKYFTYSNVLLLTNYNEFKMPNMYGWTKSEVIDFWTITGKEINIIGSGVCTEQSLQSNTVVTDEDIIEVKLD